MISNEYKNARALLNGGRNDQFNWNKIFNEIDKYKISPTPPILKPNNESLLEIAIRVNRWNSDSEGTEKRRKNRSKQLEPFLKNIKYLNKNPVAEIIAISSLL